ncbi:hypothetical protein K438DRAFT_1969835 [Mycena galopus ATCC 62051]|nr:hypothetical protein K438DRAFT_1969835 [Mycena galopus ATCC 62051]
MHNVESTLSDFILKDQFGVPAAAISVGAQLHTAADSIKELDTPETFSRKAETRALIDKLQIDCASAHQVIDMLRDKLHLLGAQVVEAKERITELEAIREGKFERVETKVEELADRLVKKEEEGARK